MTDDVAAMQNQSRCCYECGLGFWDKWRELAAPVAPWMATRTRIPEANFRDTSSELWKWSTFEPECPVRDEISSLMTALRNTSTNDHAPLNIILVGDSLDTLVVNFLCHVAKQSGLRLGLPSSSSLKLQLEMNKSTGLRQPDPRGHLRTCTTGSRFALTAFQWFGIVAAGPWGLPQLPRGRRYINPPTYSPDANSHGMDNAWMARNRDKRWWKEPRALEPAYRLETLLPRDVPDAPDATVLVLHSCLWDLSSPGTTTDPASAIFAQRYEAAVRNLTALARRRFPRAHLFWRTCPPTAYPDGRPGANITRTVRSQAMLNNAVKHAVRAMRRAGEHDVTLIDWSNMLLGYTHVLDPSDRRHYPSGPTLAYFNLLLNVLRERGLVPWETEDSSRRTQRRRHISRAKAEA